MVVAPPTIILLSATAGFGHVKAAQSLASALKLRCPGWDIVHENIGDFSGPYLRRSTEKGWLFLSTTPVLRSVYSLLHRRLLASDRICRWIAPVFFGIGESLSEMYGDRDVRAVIALHPAAVAAAVGWKRKKDFLVAAVATDLIVHGMQTLPGVDVVFADRHALLASEMAKEMYYSGRIVFSGLPVEEKFFRSDLVPHAKLDKAVVSFGALGLRGKRNVGKLITLMLKLENLRFTVICGHNPDLRQRMMREVTAAGLIDRVDVRGFVDNMEDELLEAAVFLGKPGGISVGEALATNTPIGIVDFLPGQEEANIQALRSMGARAQIFDFSAFGPEEFFALRRVRAVPMLRPRRASKSGINVIVSYLVDLLLVTGQDSKRV